jgi:Tfp pilus assembly protein PilF
MTSGTRRYVQRILCCLIASLLVITAKVFAFDKRTSNALSHYIMGVMYDDLGDVEKAIQEYKYALKADSKNTVIHLNLVVSYIKKNDLSSAVEELRTTIRLEPDAVEPHAILALLYSLQNKSQESNLEYEIALKNASKLNPKNIEIYKNLGALYLHQKKPQAAESIYRLILELAPEDAEANFYLANIYDQAGDRKKAEEELKKCLQKNPGYHEALNYLGYLYVEENKSLDEAELLIKKALELQPDNGAYVDSLGWLYFKQGKFKEAIELLSRAGTLLEDPVIFDHLGDAYFKAGDIENAKLNWQKSLKLGPTQDKVKEKLK